MLFIAIGYQELNKADPDCGTTFTWATRAFGPKTGWLGGWGILAADILVMASLAQVAGQYVFLLFNADGIGSNPTSGGCCSSGVLWIVLMTYICYVASRLSAQIAESPARRRADHAARVRRRRTGQGWARQRRCRSISFSLSWFNPFHIGSFSAFIRGLLLMLFIYWGWDSAVAVNEETADPQQDARAAPRSSPP